MVLKLKCKTLRTDDINILKAASRAGAEHTPWAYRDAKYAGVYIGVDPRY